MLRVARARELTEKVQRRPEDIAGHQVCALIALTLSELKKLVAQLA